MSMADMELIYEFKKAYELKKSGYAKVLEETIVS